MPAVVEEHDFAPFISNIHMNNEYMLFCSFLSGHLGFLEGGVFPLKKPFHYMERVVMEWVAAIRLHTDDLKI